jgi:lysophospholipase L1-like esterase
VKFRGIGKPCDLRAALVLIAFLCLSFPDLALSQPQWTGSWSAAQMPECNPHQLPKLGFTHTTLRQTVHMSLGGDSLRLHLSNLFGAEPLLIRAVSVAPATAGTLGAIAPDSSVPVRFKGAASAKVSAGEEIESDPVALPVESLSSLVVTLSIDDAPTCVTMHSGARATSFLASGNLATAVTLTNAETFTSWYFLSAVDVTNSAARGAITVIGDSITDGHGATTDGNDRWTDVLAQRLAKEKLAVLNFGIGGNHVLTDGIGPSAISRFDRDALKAANVQTVILFEGTNDLGGLDRLQAHPLPDHDKLIARIEAAMQKMAEKAHKQKLCIVAGTVTPFVGSDYYHPDEATEADRQKLNAWIRSSTIFDGVLDFDKFVLDPAHPDRMAVSADSGDHLHPGPEGYRQMGESIPLNLLMPGACHK